MLWAKQRSVRPSPPGGPPQSNKMQAGTQELPDSGRQHEKAAGKPTVSPGQSLEPTPCPFQVQAMGPKEGQADHAPVGKLKRKSHEWTRLEPPPSQMLYLLWSCPVRLPTLILRSSTFPGPGPLPWAQNVT